MLIQKMEKVRPKIIISGVESVNKGAELMLYAILAQLEKRFPDAIVYLPISQFPKGLKEIKTSLELRQSPNKLVRFLGKYHITGLLSRLGFRNNYLYNLIPITNAIYYIDASGLFFSDQMIYSEQVAKDLHKLLDGYSKQGTKIIYLPQAFGAFEKKASQIAVKAALKYSNLLIVRDNISMKYLSAFKQKDDNIKQYPDFTNLVQGYVPNEYRYLSGKVCIIPNEQVIRKGIMSRVHYITLIANLVQTVYDNGYEAFFLDHAKDLDIIKECQKQIGLNLPIVCDLDAISVKGIIGQSYLCISSRFHGVVSALSSSVPCLTTSWNHKYIELLKLYGMENSLMSELKDENSKKIQYFLLKENNVKTREILQSKNELVKQQVKDMWECVWNV